MDVEASGLLNMVRGLIQQRQYDTALNAIGIFLQETPEDQVLLNLFGSTAYEGKRFAEALGAIEALEKLGAGNAMLSSYKSRCLFQLRRASEAVEITRTLVAANPGDTENKILLSQYLRALGEFDESFSLLSDVPANMPGYASLLGWHLIQQGKITEGWDTRGKELGIYRAEDLYPFPRERRLKADTNVQGKKILLVLEGGFGDEIAFVRFAQVLAKRDARTVVCATADMASIIARCPDVESVCLATDISEQEFDYYLPSMSALSVLQISDPQADVLFPYLSPLPEKTNEMKPFIERAANGKKKIGIHWQGNPEFDYIEFKSVPVELLLLLSEIGHLFSFQRNGRALGLPADAPVTDMEVQTPTWEDTLAALQEMDCIVSADTTVAHMAGALGKKVALLVPHAPHPYWAALSEESQWYPSVRVFRQPKYNDWQGATAAVREYIETS